MAIAIEMNFGGLIILTYMGSFIELRKCSTNLRLFNMATCESSSTPENVLFE